MCVCVCVCPHYADVTSLSVFGGNFVFAKVRRGLISIRCSKLRGVRFSEVQNVLVLWWGLISVCCLKLKGVRFSEVQNVLVLW